MTDAAVAVAGAWTTDPSLLPAELHDAFRAVMGWGGMAVWDDSVDILEEICEGRGTEERLQRACELAQHVAEASRCDLGRSGGYAVLESLEQNRAAFAAAVGAKAPIPRGTYARAVVAPCMAACPAGVDIPAYVEQLRIDEVERSSEAVRKRCPMPATIGRVCVRPCEDACRPVADIFLDPLVLAVNCNQDVAMETVEAVRMFKMMADPPPTTVIGLSNISNGALPDVRPLINRVLMVMAMGAGLDSAIADPLDNVQNEWIRIAEQHDDSTPLGKLIGALYDAVAAMDVLGQSAVDLGDQEQVELWKTYRMLTNETLYADSYLQL